MEVDLGSRPPKSKIAGAHCHRKTIAFLYAKLYILALLMEIDLGPRPPKSKIAGVHCYRKTIAFPMQNCTFWLS